MAGETMAACADNVCRPLQLTSGYSPGKITITDSVGIKGVNQKEDVRTIQNALNGVPEKEGRPNPSLVPDGICGTKTKDWIQKFQVRHFGWKLADGRVDPFRPTIAKLNELNPGSGYTIGTGSRENRIARVISMLGETLSTIRAARTNLLAAMTVVNEPNITSPFSVFSRAALMKKVNRHFDVDKHPAAQREAILQRLIKIYDRMLDVFARKGGFWGTSVFELDPTNAKLYLAFTRGGGYFSSGETYIYNGYTLRKDSIYFCELMDLQGEDRFVSTTVHELSHFCGGRWRGPEWIRDHAYGWYDSPKMKKLTLQQKLFNAASYANFAFDAKYSRMPAWSNF